MPTMRIILLFNVFEDGQMSRPRLMGCLVQIYRNQSRMQMKKGIFK